MELSIKFKINDHQAIGTNRIADLSRKTPSDFWTAMLTLIKNFFSSTSKQELNWRGCSQRILMWDKKIHSNWNSKLSAQFTMSIEISCCDISASSNKLLAKCLLKQLASNYFSAFSCHKFYCMIFNKRRNSDTEHLTFAINSLKCLNFLRNHYDG